MLGWLYRQRDRLRARAGIVGRWMYRHRVVLIGVVVTAYGVGSLVAEVPVLVDAIAAGIGVALSMGEVLALRNPSRPLYHPRSAEDLSQLSTPECPDSRPLTIPKGDCGYLYGEQSRRLRMDEPIRVSVDPAPFKPDSEQRHWGEGYLDDLAKKRTVFNGAVLGLASDMPTTTDEDASVVVRRCRYHDFVRSNLLATIDIYDPRQGIVFRGRRFFVDRKNRVRSLRESRLANVIGLSTLAFTTDGKLVYTTQSETSVGSSQLLAPSGSGALEPRDLVDANHSDTLQHLIVWGVERELREEVNLTPAEVGRTVLIGFGRWISRGAMPEFAAVTLLNMPSHQLDGRKVRKRETSFTLNIGTIRLAPYETWDPRQPVKCLPEQFQNIASFPLALALSALADCIRDDSWPLAQELRCRLDA